MSQVGVESSTLLISSCVVLLVGNNPLRTETLRDLPVWKLCAPDNVAQTDTTQKVLERVLLTVTPMIDNELDLGSLDGRVSLDANGFKFLD